MKLSRIASIVAVVFLLGVMMLPQARPAEALQTNELFVDNWSKATSAVLSQGATGTWESNGVGSASVLKDGSTYKMWYTGFNVDSVLAIGYATSSDGTSWAKSGSNPVLQKGTTGAWDANGVGSQTVIKDGSTYKMWYTGINASFLPAIGYATSSDGITWTKVGTVTWTGTAAAFEATGVLGATVIKDGATYKMWYTGRSTTTGASAGNWAIGYATSTDGQSWARYASNPVLTYGSTGAWDSRASGLPSVIKTTVASTTVYLMAYTGYAGAGTSGLIPEVGFVGSTDGITWVKYAGERVLKKATSGTAWDGRGVGPVSLMRDGNTYKMWYSGLNSSLLSNIGYATSFTYAFHVDLQNGWNIMSTPIALDGNTWGAITTERGTALDYVIAYSHNPVTGAFSQVLNSDTLTPLTGVYIKMSSADSVPLWVGSDLTAPPTRTLSTGWNLIGPSNWPMNSTPNITPDVLTSVYETATGARGYTNVVSPGLNQTYWAYARNSTAIPMVEMGRGYWVYMENSDILAGNTVTPLQ